MALAKVVIAPGTVLQLPALDTGLSVLTDLAIGIISIDNISDIEYAKVKSTELLSTRKTSVPGLPEYMDMTIKARYSRLGWQGIMSRLGVVNPSASPSAPMFYTIVLRNLDAFAIEGYIRKISAAVPEADAEEPDSFEFIMAVNGVTFTAAS